MSSQRNYFADRLLLRRVWDEFAIIATTEPERDFAAKIPAARLLIRFTWPMRSRMHIVLDSAKAVGDRRIPARRAEIPEALERVDIWQRRLPRLSFFVGTFLQLRETTMDAWLSTETGKLVVAFVGGLLLATIASLAKGYFSVRGKNIATKHDLFQLQKQLTENTEITKKVEQRFSQEDVLWRSELDYREQQLREFYGPAYGILKTENDIYDLWMKRQMDDVNWDVKKYFHNDNNMIRELIIKKAHLIEGETMPDCFVKFITNSVVFGLYAVPSENGAIPAHLEENPRVKYPFDFDTHIIETTERLKARIELLHKKYALPLN